MAMLFCFALPSTWAQNFKVGVIDIKIEKKKKVKNDHIQHFAELEIGIPVDTGYEKEDSAFGIGANYTVGYRLNKMAFLGVSLGVGHLDTDPKHEYWYEDDYGHTFEGFYAKLLLNGKIYFTKTKVQPFLDLSAGGIFFKQQDYPEYSWGFEKEFGVIFNPSIGVNFNLPKRGAVFASVGGNIMPKYFPEGYMTLKIGYRF